MKSAMLAMLIVLAATDRPPVPLPPAEEATLGARPVADTPVAVGDGAAKGPSSVAPKPESVKLSVPTIPVTATPAISLDGRAVQPGKPAPQMVKLTAPGLSADPCKPLLSSKLTPAMEAFLATTDAERQQILAREQLRYATDRKRRPLPTGFLLGGCVARGQATNPQYPNLIWVVEAGRERDAKFIEQNPDVRFIVADERPDAVLTFRWLHLIDQDTCVAVVLGTSQCRWVSPETLAVTAQDLAERRRYLANLTDAPILLAVSRVNAQELVNNQWMKAFPAGEPWDGYAFVGFSTFRGLREMGKQAICRDAGVPEDRPAVIFHWHDAATRKGAEEDLARTRQVWQANAGPFVKKLLADGWKGFLMDLFTPEQIWTRMDYLQPLVEKAR